MASTLSQLQLPFFTVVSERAVRLQMETSGEQPYSARRLLLQQGQETSNMRTSGETQICSALSVFLSMVSCQKCWLTSQDVAKGHRETFAKVTDTTVYDKSQIKFV